MLLDALQSAAGSHEVGTNNWPFSLNSAHVQSDGVQKLCKLLSVMNVSDGMTDQIYGHSEKL